MKKYILNIFPTDPKSYGTQNDYRKAIEDQAMLAYNIGLYNQDQPEQDFINYLKNKMPYLFLFTPIGQLTTTDGEPHTYDVQWSDEYRRIGTIEVSEEVDVLDKVLTIVEKAIKDGNDKVLDTFSSNLNQIQERINTAYCLKLDSQN